MIYEPFEFIRCHGNGKDDVASDTKTSIWDAAFEPDVHDSSKITNNVATCGGIAICITNIETKEVLMKYEHRDTSEEFYTLAWAIFPYEDGTSKAVLVSGSKKGEICFFLPEIKECFYMWPFTKNLMRTNRQRKRSVSKKVFGAVSSLVCHSKMKNWLFIALRSGDIYLYDIGSNFIMPKYEEINPQQLMKFEAQLGEVYNIVWTGNESKWLIAGTQEGMVGWKIEEEKTSPIQATKRTLVHFKIPKCSRKNVDQNVTIVDSITMLNEWTVLTKCVSHGCIYVINLENAVQDIKVIDWNKKSRIETDVRVTAELYWKQCDAYYTNIGCNAQGLICCGDDVGSLWVYDQPDLDMMGGKGRYPPVLKPDVRLMWPPVQDDHLENTEEIPEKDRNEIIVNKVAVSQNGEKIIAVTSNNLICIWERQPDRIKTK